jgi:hypothetical protein
MSVMLILMHQSETIALRALDLLEKECEATSKSLATLGLPSAQVDALQGQGALAGVEIKRAAARARERAQEFQNGGYPAFVSLESESASALATGLLILMHKCKRVGESQLKLGIEPADTLHRTEEIEELWRRIVGDAELFEESTGEVQEQTELATT